MSLAPAMRGLPRQSRAVWMRQNRCMLAARRSRCASACNVGFILARRFTLCAFANFVDVLRLAADEGDRSGRSSAPGRVLSDTHGPDRLELRGRRSSRTSASATRRGSTTSSWSAGWWTRSRTCSPDTVRFLRAAAAAGVPLVGVCTGAFILHRAGLMHGYRCLRQLVPPRRFPGAVRRAEPVSDQIFVVDRDRLTCSGRGELGASRGLIWSSGTSAGAGAQRACTS